MRETRSFGVNEEQVMHAMGIDDAYKVVRVLARGRGGETELVTLDGSGPFVRKRIPLDLANRRVWAALASSTCPRLPRVAATYEMPDCFAVVYDFVPGSTLEQVMAAQGAMSASEAARLAGELCDALEALHGLGIVHRDISPGNIIVAADGAHLIDFGIAAMLSECVERDEKALGTWGFASPEQYGFAGVDERSDVYAVGRVLGYLLTGVQPDEKSYEGLLENSTTVSDELRGVALRAGAFEPSARYGSAAEFGRALAAAMGEKVAPLPPSSDGKRVARRAEGAVRSDMPPAAGALSGEGRARIPEDASAGRRSPLGQVLSFLDARQERKAAERAAERRFTLIIGAGCVAFVLLMIAIALWHSSVENAPTLSRGGGTAPSTIPDNEKGASSDIPDIVASSESNLADILSIAEFGWSVDPIGYVNYGLALRNSSEETAIALPAVNVVGYDEEGTVLFTDSVILSEILPGETLYAGGQAGRGTPPAEVKLEVERPNAVNALIETGARPDYEVTGLSEVAQPYGSISFSGKVERKTEGASVLYDTGQISVCVILRDEAGKIVYGNTTLVSRPEVGESVAFEVGGYGVPEYASIEAYATPS